MLILVGIAGVSGADTNQNNNNVTVGGGSEVIEIDSVMGSDLNDDLTSANEESDNFINEKLSEMNDDNLKENEPSDQDSVGSFSELEELILNSSGEVILEKDYSFDPVSDAKFNGEGIKLKINKLVIDGQNHIMDGKGKSGLFFFMDTEGNITLKNINFINGLGKDSIFQFGAVSTMSHTSVYNCTFINNSGTYAGALSAEIVTYVENCTFINNTATELGGAIGFFLNTQSVVVNSRFIGNSAPQAGGAIYSQGILISLFNVFDNNTADRGGAIYLSLGMAYVNTSVFTNNNAKQGGAIYTGKDLSVENSYFLFNNAEDNSPNVGIDPIYGRIVLDNNNHQPLRPYDFSRLQADINNCAGNVLTLTNDYYCTVADSQAMPYGVTINKKITIDGQGHIIYGGDRTRIFDVRVDDVTFKNITFAGGSTFSEGGAIYFLKSGVVNNCTFIDNHARIGGAVVFFGEGTVIDSIFLNNTVTQDGGAIYFNTYGMVETSMFINNIAPENGGAIYSNNGRCNILMSNFTFNQANNGGALYLNNGGNIFDSSFLANQAKLFGGAITTGGNLSIDYGVYAYNFASDSSYNIKSLSEDIVITISDTIPESLIPKSFHDLEIAINESEDTLFLTDDYVYDTDKDNRNGFTITKNLIIDGRGHILIGANKIRLFTINASNVILKNIIFMNFTADGSNGVNIIEFLNNGTIENCTFIDNFANESIISLNQGEIKNSNFVNNTAVNSGTVMMKNGTVDTCIFSGNIAKLGGAIYIGEDAVVRNSTFYLNKGTEYAGAIYVHMNASITNCTFFSNYAKQGGAIYSRFIFIEHSYFIQNEGLTNAAVYAEKGFVNDSNFLMNKAEFQGAVNFGEGTVKNSNFTLNQGIGGAVRFGFNGLVDNSTFNFNSALSSYGGAIEFMCNGTVKDSVFNLNNGTRGGAIYVDQYGTIYNSIFNMNHGTLGGAINCYYKPTLIYNCTFNNNTGTEGTVYFYTPGTISNCTFNINQAENGGGIYIRDSAEINNCSFNGNQANNGSAIYSAKDGKVSGCNFYYNYGDLDAGSVVYFNSNGDIENSTFLNDIGGSIILIKGNGNIDTCNFNNTINTLGAVNLINGLVQNCYFFNNTAVSKGSAIYSINATVQNSIFDSNQVGEQGGAVYAHDGLIKNCKFTNNKALYDGGAISALNLTLEDCYFFNNTAVYDGGAVHIKENGILNNDKFDTNYAAASRKNHGGALYINKGIVDNCIFNNSIAITYGGGIYAIDAVVNNSVFTNNAVYTPLSSYGGAIFFYKNGRVENSNFTNNHADYSGGAITFYADGSVKNCRFDNNIMCWDSELTPVSFGSSGAVTGYSRPITVEDSVFNNNLGGLGGALFMRGGEVINCHFFNNIGNYTGGGALYSSDPIFVDGCIFVNNSVLGIGGEGDGGAIQVVFSNATIQNSFFDDNYATGKGGAISLEKYSVVKNCFFNNNHASSGGAIANGGILQLSYSIFNNNHYADDGTNYICLTNDDARVITKYVTPEDLNPMKNTLGAVSDSYIILASDNAYVINYGGTYSIMVKDNHNVLVTGENVTLLFNGKIIASAITDENGMANFNITSAMLKTIKVGTKHIVIKLDSNYKSASKTVKITIKKDKTKIVAKNKSFKKSLKTKKYAITLKNSKGKTVKKVRVILKINGKTFKAKTNAKGKAVFNIKKISKKGTFKATITFKGNTNYQKAVKKVSIKMK